jgi:hypothetical protein
MRTKSSEETAMRPRTIRWLVTVDETAKELASKQRTTVSGLLAALVIHEKARQERL